MKYPLELKRGDVVIAEGRPHKVHRTDFYEEERYGALANVVLVETRTGTTLTYRLAETVAS